jgi:hypothetical protein
MFKAMMENIAARSADVVFLRGACTSRYGVTPMNWRRR